MPTELAPDAQTCIPTTPASSPKPMVITVGSIPIPVKQEAPLQAEEAEQQRLLRERISKEATHDVLKKLQARQKHDMKYVDAE